MKVTVCELSDNEVNLIEDWARLKTHLESNKADLLLLPEMPFCKWIASEPNVDDATKILSVQKHESWMQEIEQLTVKYTVYSKPVIEGGKFLNTAFVYEAGIDTVKFTRRPFFLRGIFWEETWYDREDVVSFEPFELDGFKIGVLMCTEMWFTGHARSYGKQGSIFFLCQGRRVSAP